MSKRKGRPSLGLLALTLSGIALSLAAVVAAVPASEAEAIAPCVQHTPSGDELTFLSALQAHRTGMGEPLMTQSAPLNAAAQGYAQFLANTPGASGHNADGAGGQNSPWVTRALNCGYPLPGGGEGVAIAASASAALAVMTAEGGSGVNAESTPSFKFRCVGIGKATSGNKTAWVVLVFGNFGGPCASAVTNATVPPSSATTSTSTPTNTATPTKTPTPSPTPRGDGATLTLYQGWNLVTLPKGPVAEVLHRAEGCYRAIYQQNGSAWLRYSPEAPAYANNLQMLNGGAFWIEGTAENCGVVPL